MIQREQQFVEKLHAYTLPRPSAPNSRVRDLVDMALLIQSGTLESSRVVQALHATFDLRATHSVPNALDPPSKEWDAPFARLAAECRLELSADDAFRVRRNSIWLSEPEGIQRNCAREPWSHIAGTLRLVYTVGLPFDP
jgi:Nucleotidyl transferase AbiEii toxin, Type IV TA system